MQQTKFQLYTKSDCPLCDKAQAVLEEVGQEFSIQVEEIDITINMGLFTKYKNLIPVLTMDGRRLFVHRINAAALKRMLVWRKLRQQFAGF